METTAAETPNSEALPRLQDMKPEDLATYLEKGELPGEKPSEGGETAKSGAESETAKPAQEPAEEENAGHSRFQRRIDKLTADKKKLEARLAELTGNERPSPQEKPFESTSKAPRFRDFQNKIGTTYKDWDEAHDAWETARDGFHEQQRKDAVAEAVKTEREQQSTLEAQAEAKKAEEKAVKKFKERAEEFRKTLKKDDFYQSVDELKEAIDEAMERNNAYAEISHIILDSEVGPELIHYFGQNPKELDAILQLPITRAIRALGQLEVSDKIKAPTPKTHTAAKKIGDSVKGATVTSDAEDAALAKNDVEGVMKARGIKRQGW